MHIIPMANINEYNHFDEFGNLTSSGQLKFCHEINDFVRNLDKSKAVQNSSSTSVENHPSLVSQVVNAGQHNNNTSNRNNVNNCAQNRHHPSRGLPP